MYIVFPGASSYNEKKVYSEEEKRGERPGAFV